MSVSISKRKSSFKFSDDRITAKVNGKIVVYSSVQSDLNTIFANNSTTINNKIADYGTALSGIYGSVVEDNKPSGNLENGN